MNDEQEFNLLVRGSLILGFVGLISVVFYSAFFMPDIVTTEEEEVSFVIQQEQILSTSISNRFEKESICEKGLDANDCDNFQRKIMYKISIEEIYIGLNILKNQSHTFSYMSKSIIENKIEFYQNELVVWKYELEQLNIKIREERIEQTGIETRNEVKALKAQLQATGAI